MVKKNVSKLKLSVEGKLDQVVIDNFCMLLNEYSFSSLACGWYFKKLA